MSSLSNHCPQTRPSLTQAELRPTDKPYSPRAWLQASGEDQLMSCSATLPASHDARYVKADHLNALRNEYIRKGLPVQAVKMTKEAAWEASETVLLESVQQLMAFCSCTHPGLNESLG